MVNSCISGLLMGRFLLFLFQLASASILGKVYHQLRALPCTESFREWIALPMWCYVLWFWLCVLLMPSTAISLLTHLFFFSPLLSMTAGKSGVWSQHDQLVWKVMKTDTSSWLLSSALDLNSWCTFLVTITLHIRKIPWLDAFTIW